MESRGRGVRIQCVNCNICVNTLRRYSVFDLDPRSNALLRSWVYPQIITEDDFICEACRDLVIFRVNENLQRETGPGGQEAGPSGRGQEAGPSERGHTHVCHLCGRSILRRQSDIILRENPTELHQLMVDIMRSKVIPRQITASDRVCHACNLRIQREARRIIRLNEMRPQAEAVDESQAEAVDESQAEAVNEPPAEREVEARPELLQEEQPLRATPFEQSVLRNYRRAANNNNRCVFPNCNSTTFHGIPDKLRAIVLSNHNYYLPNLARVCTEHLMSNSWDTLYASENSISTFTIDQIAHVFSFVNAFNPTLDFDNVQNMDARVFEYWMGVTKEQFNILLEEVPRIYRKPRGVLGLAALLLKMRTGDSDERISTLVEVPRRTLETLMDSVRDILLQDFVPRNLGINHITPEELRQHNLTIHNELFGDENNVIVICDGTYVYINKSSNYMFQKQTYSLHKYRNLLKPFLIVASDGYIVDCFGPYKATQSDADIMCNLFCEGSPLRSYFRAGDVFILDRGFRDSIGLLEQCGYVAKIPESLLEGEHQLTTAQANRSRCVTICRWVVEAVNGHFKRDFKLLRQEYCHRSLPHMMQNFQIAAALINRFGVRFQDNIYATEILDVIRERVDLPNNLANMIEAINMNRRTSAFESITADRNNLLYFPTLEYRDLILFALGTYQIRQARSYYGEHVRLHGGYRIEVCSELINSSEYNLRGDTTLIRGKIKSRHISGKQYFVYIIIENNIPGRTGIIEYYCNCMVGRRTLGCCAHVMTLVWFLGWARHQQNISAPAEFLDDVYIREDEEE